MQTSLGVIVLGILVLILYSWKIGLTVLMAGCISFITMEAISAPPENGPVNFIGWSRRQNTRKPVLVCLGDSLTHGNCSASITPEIPPKLCQALGMTPPKYNEIFSDPLWIVNCGQNGMTSRTILHERLSQALGCHPDYILLWIGTNDVRAVYKQSWSKEVVRINDLPLAPTLDGFERNLKGIVDFIRQSSPTVQIGICTLPPMGEDLKSKANAVVRKANDIIERVAGSDGEKTTLIPVFGRLEAILEKKRRSWNTPSVDWFFWISVVMNPLFHVIPFFSWCNWNSLSKPFSHAILNDGLHLNEHGRDEVVDLIVDWLLKKNIAKAIAVKS
jgi:lysophospholipase L1-like esterase